MGASVESVKQGVGELGELRFSNKAREFRSSGWDESGGKDGPSDSPETSEGTDPKTIIVYVKDGIAALHSALRAFNINIRSLGTEVWGGRRDNVLLCWRTTVSPDLGLLLQFFIKCVTRG